MLYAGSLDYLRLQPLVGQWLFCGLMLGALHLIREGFISHLTVGILVKTLQLVATQVINNLTSSYPGYGYITVVVIHLTSSYPICEPI